jgi:hypothetical protein
MRRLAAKGLALLADKPIEQQKRLQEMHDLYAFMEEALPGLLEQWDEKQKQS